MDDGRRWLHRHADPFDVIVMNTTWHWRSNITNLLSREFMALARAHVTDDNMRPEWRKVFRFQAPPP